MGELTASLAHELNQPLGAIMTRAARCQPAAKTPDLTEIEEALEDIIRDDAQAVNIVRNVRAIFKRSEATKSPVDVKELLLDVSRITLLMGCGRSIDAFGRSRRCRELSSLGTILVRNEHA